MIYLITIVDKLTRSRCILGWKVVWDRTIEQFQELVDDTPKARFYFSDGFDACAALWYHFGRYDVSVGKTDTYSVEGDNAELRHYLARLSRSSRCFSRRPEALCSAMRLFVYSLHARQLYKQRFPKYPADVMNFSYPLIQPLPSLHRWVSRENTNSGQHLPGRQEPEFFVERSDYLGEIMLLGNLRLSIQATSADAQRI